MKKQLLTVMAVVILALTAFAAPVAQAKPPTSPLNHGPITNRYSGDTAYGMSWSTTDGCIYSNVSVMASTQTVKSSTGGTSTGQYATLSIDRYDNCTWSWLGSLSGSAAIDKNSFQMDKQLNNAHLQINIPVSDWNTGVASNFTVDLTWTGSGELLKGKTRNQYQSPTCKYTYTSSGSSRNATISGSISDGSTEYLNSATATGSLQSVKQGDMMMGCGM